MGIFDEGLGYIEEAFIEADNVVDDVIDGIGYYGDTVTDGKASEFIEGIEYHGAEAMDLINDPKGWWEENITDYFKGGDPLPDLDPNPASLEAIWRLAPTRDNETIANAREELERSLTAAGLNDAAATAAGARFAQRGYMQLGEASGSLNSSLTALLNALETQSASISDQSNAEAFFYSFL